MVDFEIKDKYNVDDFRRLIAVLRAPGGCPWDREQTHESIRRNLLEEAYETAQAIDTGDKDNLREELGDLLMQVLFHARIEEEQGGFNLDDVADAACKKLVFRHPHVFGDVRADTSDEVLDTWDKVKRIEKAQKTTATAMDDVAEALPALWRAEKVQKKAAKVGFDWDGVDGAIEKLREETDELEGGIKAGDADNCEEEIGDILFSAVNAARFLKVDPEKALHRSCRKFIDRFRFVEDTAAKQGKRLEDMSLEEMDEIYEIARQEAKRPPQRN